MFELLCNFIYYFFEFLKRGYLKMLDFLNNKYLIGNRYIILLCLEIKVQNKLEEKNILVVEYLGII